MKTSTKSSSANQIRIVIPSSASAFFHHRKMDLQSPSMAALFAFLILALMLAIFTKSCKSKKSIQKLPPGPWQLPLIGNMHQLAIGGPLIHRSLTELARKYGPLMHLQLGELSTVVVSSPEMAREVMKTHDTIFANRPHLLASRILHYDSTDIAFSPYGDYWKQLRKICMMELLSPKRVQSFRAIREEEVWSLIRTASSSVGLPINISRKILSLIYGITARSTFGKKSRDQEAFILLIEEVVAMMAGFSIADMYPSVKGLQVITGIRAKLLKVHRRIDEILENILNDHKDRKAKGKAEDLVDVLLRVQKHGELEFPLTDDNIKAVIMDIFSAGGETSSTAVEWVISELLRNPQSLKRAQAEVRQFFHGRGNVDESGFQELKYLKSVIKETMRLHPPAPLSLPRESSKQCQINGYEIPAKMKVIVNLWAISRDPQHWARAEEFDPDRFLDSAVDFKGTDYEYIPFGAGRRICPGVSFAMPNVELLLAQLLYHFDWKLPGGMKQEELDMAEAFGLTVRRKHDLCLILTPYEGSSLNVTSSHDT